MNTIAGHTFVFGLCSCGRTWTDIRNVTEADVGAHGIAHSSYLSRNEYNQIVAERLAEDSRIADAMGYASHRDGPVAATEDMVEF